MSAPHRSHLSRRRGGQPRRPRRSSSVAPPRPIAAAAASPSPSPAAPRRNGCIELLAEPPSAVAGRLGRVEIFWGDERCVPPDHKDSNYHMAREAMLSQLPIPADHIHRMEAERHRPRRGGARLPGRPRPRLRRRRRTGRRRRSIWSCWAWGRTATPPRCFRDTAALDETNALGRRQPRAASSTPDRLTLTRPILNAPMRCCFSSPAPTRREPLVEVLEGPPDPRRLPSQRIRPTYGLLVPGTWTARRRLASPLDPRGNGKDRTMRAAVDQTGPVDPGRRLRPTGRAGPRGGAGRRRPHPRRCHGRPFRAEHHDGAGGGEVRCGR